MYTSQVEAYRSTQKMTMSPRQIEAEVLTKAALMLKECQEEWEAEDRVENLDKALKYNQLMWSIFQAELSREDNPLPKKLKQDILSLSAFIDKRIFEVMAYPSPEKLTVIININMGLASGLRKQVTEKTEK